MTVPFLVQDVHPGVALVVVDIEKKVVIGTIEIEKENVQEKENVIAVIVNANAENEVEQYVKENVNVIDVGKEKEKKNHRLEEGILMCLNYYNTLLNFIIFMVRKTRSTDRKSRSGSRRSRTRSKSKVC